MMDAALQSGTWLAGGPPFSLADAAVIPYILRLDLLHLGKIWAHKRRSRSGTSDAERPSVRRS